MEGYDGEAVRRQPQPSRFRVALKGMVHVNTMLVPIDVFNDTATTEIYTLSLHDALPIC